MIKLQVTFAIANAIENLLKETMTEYQLILRRAQHSQSVITNSIWYFLYWGQIIHSFINASCNQEHLINNSSLFSALFYTCLIIFSFCLLRFVVNLVVFVYVSKSNALRSMTIKKYSYRLYKWCKKIRSNIFKNKIQEKLQLPKP